MSKPLSADFVKRVKKIGRHGDGPGGCGLALNVKPMTSSTRLSKTWTQRIRINGRVTNLGLGPYPRIPLSKARELAVRNARLVSEGIDPRAEKLVPKFAEASEKTLAMQNHQSAKTVKAWRSLMDRYCQPIINARVDQITTADLLGFLSPLWSDKRATAQLLKVRLSAIFKWAIAQGYRSDNPAGESLSAVLPKNGNHVAHRKAVPYADIPAALERIKKTNAYKGLTLALEFLILTASRSGEVRGARWSEIDLDAKTWIVPGNRMKAGRAHRVPLSNRCLEILNEARSLSLDTSGLVFPSHITGKAMPDNALSGLCKTLNLGGTPHGFRSSFRDWAAETSKPREIAEAALAHVVGGTEGAYFRSDLFEQRRELMDQWADFVVA